MLTSRMPSIRDIVAILSRRPGVEAALLVGRDGLLIDGEAADQAGLEAVAAHLPALIGASADLSAAIGRGHLISEILEFERGFAMVSTLTADVALFVVLAPGADLPSIAGEVRRHRSHIAAIL